MAKFETKTINNSSMKTFPKSKTLAVIAMAFLTVVVSALWCASSLVENVQASCLAYDKQYGVIISCDGEDGYCYFARPDGTYARCTGSNGAVSYPLNPVIIEEGEMHPDPAI